MRFWTFVSLSTACRVLVIAVLSTVGCSGKTSRGDETPTAVCGQSSCGACAPGCTTADFCDDSTQQWQCDCACPSALVGTWNYSGRVPAAVTIRLTINSDKTFTFAETVAPPSFPAGIGSGAPCVTTDTLVGTYVETVSDSTNTLTLAFADGMRNAISECGSNNSTGTPMTADDITGYTGQGLLLPTTNAYTVTETTLELTATVNSTSKLFTKSP